MPGNVQYRIPRSNSMPMNHLFLLVILAELSPFLPVRQIYIYIFIYADHGRIVCNVSVPSRGQYRDVMRGIMKPVEVHSLKQEVHRRHRESGKKTCDYGKYILW